MCERIIDWLSPQLTAQDKLGSAFIWCIHAIGNAIHLNCRSTAGLDRNATKGS